MPFRFRRTLSLFPGVRLNLGKSGASVSVGPKGARLTAGSKGLRASAGLPGTGMFFSKQITSSHAEHSEPMTLPPEIQQILQSRPPNWEFLVLQAALRAAADDIKQMAATAASPGIDAVTFFEWVNETFPQFKEISAEFQQAFNDVMTAMGAPGQSGDPDRILDAVDLLVAVVRSAIEYQQRLATLARHPVYGVLAEPLSNLARPFVDAFNEILQKLDDQIPKLAVTNVVDLDIALKLGPSPEAFDNALKEYGQRFFDFTKPALRTGDVVAERFRIARGQNELGTFRRSAIADNLANNLFRKDDLYWSEDAKGWRPLSDLVL